MMKRSALCLFILCAAAPTLVFGEAVEVVGGQTNVTLDTDALSDLASLDLSGVSDDVIVPGTDPYAVAFPINPRDAMAPALPTTFAYDTDDFLGTFSGTIEHTGSVFFNDDAIELGNFTIGFDAGRIGASASGFFVQDTASLGAILFDVENPTGLTPGATELLIEANLLVSPELAQFLLDNGFAMIDLTGADIGDAFVEGVSVPEPAMATLALVGVAGFAIRRRR